MQTGDAVARRVLAALQAPGVATRRSDLLSVRLIWDRVVDGSLPAGDRVHRAFIHPLWFLTPSFPSFSRLRLHDKVCDRPPPGLGVEARARGSAAGQRIPRRRDHAVRGMCEVGRVCVFSVGTPALPWTFATGDGVW